MLKYFESLLHWNIFVKPEILQHMHFQKKIMVLLAAIKVIEHYDLTKYNRQKLLDIFSGTLSRSKVQFLNNWSYLFVNLANP